MSGVELVKLVRSTTAELVPFCRFTRAVPVHLLVSFLVSRVEEGGGCAAVRV